MSTPPIHLSKLLPGDVIVADEGFECLKAGRLYTVKASPASQPNHLALYVNCLHGQHFLDAQRNERDEVTGFHWPEPGGLADEDI